MMKFNDIFHKYQTELFWFDGMIFAPLIRSEIPHFSGISLGGRTLGTPVYSINYVAEFQPHSHTKNS